MDKESPEEKLEKVEIKKIEEQRLEQVFRLLCNPDGKQEDDKTENLITKGKIMKILK